MLRSQTCNHAQIDGVYYTVLAGPKPPVLWNARIKGVRHLTGFLKTIILWQFHHVYNTFCHFHSSLIPEFLLPISFHHFHAFFCDLLSTSTISLTGVLAWAWVWPTDQGLHREEYDPLPNQVHQRRWRFMVLPPMLECWWAQACAEFMVQEPGYVQKTVSHSAPLPPLAPRCLQPLHCSRFLYISVLFVIMH